MKIPLGMGGLKLNFKFEKLEERPIEYAKLSSKGQGVGAIVAMETEFNLSPTARRPTWTWDGRRPRRRPDRLDGPAGLPADRQPAGRERAGRARGAGRRGEGAGDATSGERCLELHGAPFRIGVMQLTMEPLEEILEHARAMDEGGFDTIWLAEAYPWWRKHSMEARSSTALSPLIARETERLAVGWGIISPFTRHPIQIAMEARVTQEAAGAGTLLPRARRLEDLHAPRRDRVEAGRRDEGGGGDHPAHRSRARRSTSTARSSRRTSRRSRTTPTRRAGTCRSTSPAPGR